MSLEVISIMTTIALALLGYLITYWNSLRITKRQEQLELINRRISEFYGPLFVATQTSLKAYQSLLAKLHKTGLFNDPKSPTTDKDIAEWQVWLENVLMPNNELIEKLIIEKAYLIQEEDMPGCLLDFITHVSGYRAVISKWKAGNFSEYTSTIPFPQELPRYAADSYRRLKAKQLELIGKVKLDGKVGR